MGMFDFLDRQNNKQLSYAERLDPTGTVRKVNKALGIRGSDQQAIDPTPTTPTYSQALLAQQQSDLINAKKGFASTMLSTRAGSRSTLGGT
jgi:hypothetical protein